MKKKKPVRYPWDKWLAYKREYRLKKGKDFDCMVHSMSVQVRNAAYRRGMSVQVVIDEGDQCLYVVNCPNRGIPHASS